MSDQTAPTIPETLLIGFPDGRIEEMRVDSYLKGVVPTEMGLQKPIEALKAQAIAARSYAVTTRRHASDGYDMCTTTHCQVYKPKNRYADSDLAVDETSGQVLAYEGKMVGAPFFGHCDGHTRNSEDVWSQKVDYLRSVPCICGYNKLYGHGVGMCQRGAAAMAEQGASASAILAHYYSGAEVIGTLSMPRTSFRRSMILGQVLDARKQPRGDLRLVLHGSSGPVNKGTTQDGRFFFTNLPAGQWELRVSGRPIRFPELVTDGRNTLDLEIVVPDPNELALIAQTMPLAYPPLLAGTLGLNGVEITVVDAEGREQSVLSGSAPEYDPGGFVLPLPATRTFTVSVLDQSFELEVDEGGLWVRFFAW
jgi:hypothetical protein